jgi:aspartate ammonia-lyase
MKEGLMRIEHDSLGEMALPDDALYGIESARARENFPLDYKPVNRALVLAMITVKKAAALTYRRLARSPDKGGGNRDAAVYGVIIDACDRLLAGEATEAFIVDALQGGAGTSLNMNVNEVIANLALRIMGKAPGCYEIIHPLDDVNRGQSTNDVYPTALRIAAIRLLRDLSEGCAKLQEALQKKENEFGAIKKLGRTELMDAVPITLGEEFGAWAQAIGRDRWRLYKAEERLRQVNLGGTAVGRSDNAEKRYRFAVIEELRSITGIGLAAAEYPMDITQNSDVFVEVSGLLKALAVNLVKIANDLRLMNSGPRGGLGEIRLPALQRGSSIMPGKVNPVIPEMVIQAALRAEANDWAVSAAASRSEFELNAFSPLIADAILESLSLLGRAVCIFREKCIDGIEADKDRCAALLDASLAFVTAWVPRLGYDRVSGIIRENSGDPERIRLALEREPDNAMKAGE